MRVAETFDMQKSVYQNWCKANEPNGSVVALDHFGRQWTFDEAKKEIADCASALHQLQTDPESSVTFCTPTLPSTHFGLYAQRKRDKQSNFIGDAVLEKGGSHFLDRNRAETIVVLDGFYPRVAEAIARSSVKNIVVVSCSDGVENVPDFLPDQLKYALGASGVDAIKKQAIPGREYFSWQEFVDIGRNCAYPIEAVYEPGKTSVVLSTGGSTGPPKFIEKTDAEIVAMGNIYADPSLGLNLQPGERNGIFIPPNVPTSLVNSMVAQWFFGTTNVTQPFYNKHTYPQDVLSLGLDITVTTPEHPMELEGSNLLDGVYEGRLLRLCMMGGAPVTRKDFESIVRGLKRLGAAGLPTVCYGLSETGPLGIMTYGSRTGKPVPGAKARLIDSRTGEEIIGPGRGMMELSSPQTHMKRYLGDQEQTKKFFTIDNYAKTGDIAERDEDGEYDVLGRSDDSYVDANGERHYLFDIENFIHDSSELIFGVEATKLTIRDKGSAREIPVVQVVLREGVEESNAEMIRQLHEACAEGLPEQERPYGFLLLREFTLNKDSLKRDYHLLQQIRDGYYNCDEQGFYEISFPESGTFNKRHINSGDIIIR